MWSKDVFTTHFEMWGTIPNGMRQGTVTARSLRFYRDVKMIEWQVSLGWSGAVPVLEYSWELLTNFVADTGSVFELVPPGSPTGDRWFNVFVGSSRVNHVNVQQSFAANDQLQLSGFLYSLNAAAPAMSAQIYVQFFYNVKRFM